MIPGPAQWVKDPAPIAVAAAAQIRSPAPKISYAMGTAKEIVKNKILGESQTTACHSSPVFKDVPMLEPRETMVFFVEPNKMLIHLISLSYGKSILLKRRYVCVSRMQKKTFFFFRAAPVAYGGSQVRGLIGAVAADLHQSHSNASYEPHL